ncbi:MAG: MFS transporter [Caedimonas sp.]|nr:MFS transporter [Caedimonas sp.]
MTKTLKSIDSPLPDEKKRGALPWIIWGCGGLFYFYQFIIRASPSYMTEELMQSFQVHGLALGALVSFYYYAYAPMQIPLGLLLDRFGSRRVLITSCSLCILGSMMFASSHTLTIACAGRFLMGVGSAGAWIGSLKLATLWFPADRMGVIIGATMFLGTMGPFFGGPLLANLVNYAGWRQAMYLLGAIGTLLVIFMWVFLSDRSPDSPSVSAEAQPPESILKSLQKVFFVRQVWINAAFAMLMYVPIAAFADLWGVTFIQDLYHVEKPLAASVISCVYFGMSMGAFVSAYFSDRIGSRRLPMMIGVIGSLITYSLIIYMPGISLTIMYGLTFLTGFFFTGQLMCFASAVEMVPVSSSGVVVGFTNMVVMLSGVIFQPFVGWLLDSSRRMAQDAPLHSSIYTLQDWRFSLTSIVICLVIALFLVIFIKETHPKMGVLHKHGKLKTKWKEC